MDIQWGMGGPDQDICIAGDVMVHCHSKPLLRRGFKMGPILNPRRSKTP